MIWTSDNGAPINRAPHDLSRGSNLPLHGRGYTTSEGAFRVPTIVWQPGQVPAGTVCDELASTLDLLPTFAKLATRASEPASSALGPGSSPAPVQAPPVGTPATARTSDRRIDGVDISALFFSAEKTASPRKALYYYYLDQLQAVRSGPWKLFVPLESFKTHPHFKPNAKTQTLLFNLVADIACENNVVEKHPEIVAQLTQLADEARSDLGDQAQPGQGQREPGKIDGPAQPRVLQKNALQLIEGERGGRHWIDAKTDPPKSAEDSLKCFRIEDGVRIELVAAEPLVKDPVAIEFDQRGRLFVVEYGDYPVGPAEGGEPLSRVVYLEDTDGDGRSDKRHVFADKLKFAHSLMAYNEGLLVGAQTQILFLKDTNGDNIADVRDVLYDGFEPAHPQMQIGNPRWGLDNWVYLNYGPGKITSSKWPGKTLEMPRNEVRFNPLSFEFEADSGVGQFGNTIDRWGHRFYCSNRNPIITTRFRA